jgi:Arc-like DNA binding domain
MNQKNNLVVPSDAEATVIRFPKGILKQLSEAAAKSGRSRNSEIVYRLVSTLQQDRQAA